MVKQDLKLTQQTVFLPGNGARNACWYLLTPQKNQREIIRKRTDIGEHFTREIVLEYRYLFYPQGENVRWLTKSMLLLLSCKQGILI